MRRLSRSSMALLSLSLGAGLSACQTSDIFTPKSDYPTDPWVKGYAQDGDCLGGEALAAKNIPLPDYPKSMFNSGRQGWTIVKLDVDANGNTQNIGIERSVPGGAFSTASTNAVKGWTFYPPKNGGLTSCRILFRYRLGSVSVGG